MEKYQKVQKARPETPFTENEMRITSVGLLGNYVNYATALFQERGGREIVLKGMGQAISKTVSIAEILKRRMPQLHQDTAIDSVSIVDLWEPIEEGLLPVETSHHVSAISITLSTKELNKNSPGYQAPAYVEQSRPRQNYQQGSQQQPRQAQIGYNVVSEDAYGHGRVRGRGRGWGWNRGGYRNYEGNYRGNYQGGYQRNYQGGYQRNYQGGYQGNYQGGYQGNYPGGYQVNFSGGYQRNYQENGGYSNWSQGGARGPRDGGYSYRGTGYGRGRGRGGGRGGGRGYSHNFDRMDG